MKHHIHIEWSGRHWYAKFDKTVVKSLAHIDKNRVVQSAVALARRIYGGAVVVIHSMDGRVLEERIV
jgi:hypothetical protein